MIRRQGTDRRISNWMMVIALIFGVSGTVAVSATQTPAQNQDSSQMGTMPYDLHFIDMMIMHHREGTATARLAERKGSTVALRAFAKKTADDQEKELLELRKHRDQWYAGAPEMDHSQMMATPGMAGHANMKMDMQGDIAKLQAATGKAFDRLFLDMMIHHHQMAIDMAKEATTKAEHAEIKEMARLTVLKQQKEIAEMNKLKGAGIAKGKPKPRAKAKAKPKVDHSVHEAAKTVFSIATIHCFQVRRDVLRRQRQHRRLIEGEVRITNRRNEHATNHSLSNTLNLGSCWGSLRNN